MEVIFEITAILPFANAVSERGFSAMKFLKGNRSANMTTGEGITGDDADDDDAEDDADRDASADSLDTSNNNKKKVHNTLETRIHLFLNTPARGTSEHEKLIDETTVAFWGLRKRVPKRAKGAHAANEVRRRKGDEKRAKRKKEKDDILTGASAESVADGSLHASESRSTFAPPSGHELVELKDVPELDEEFTMNVKKPKIAHRDDDDDWMLGTVKKHKIMTRTGPTGASKRARIEFQFANATQTAFFRLRAPRTTDRRESGPCLRPRPTRRRPPRRRPRRPRRARSDLHHAQDTSRLAVCCCARATIASLINLI